MLETTAAKAGNSHYGWHMQFGEDQPRGLYSRHEMPERAPHGHPLGRGHPERVPQEFRDSFHSTRENQSDMALDSESETEEEEWDDIIAYDTETSRCTTVADHDCCIARDHHRTNKRRHQERHPGHSKTKWLSLPIFRDSTSDNAITYGDWRSDVDNYVQKGHSPKLIRDSVLCVLEGRPHYTAKMVMDDGDGSLRSIMEVLDSVYSGATTYSTLMSKLNMITQGNGEAAKDYYEHVVQLRVSFRSFITSCSCWEIWSTTPRTPSSMACGQSTRQWWYISEMTHRSASWSYCSPCMSVKRLRPNTIGTDVWSM